MRRGTMTKSYSVVYCDYSQTIRLMPQNYLLAHKARPSNNYWVMEPDLAAPLGYVLLVTQVLMAFDCKYGTGEDIVHWCETLEALLIEDKEPNYLKPYI